MYGLSLGLIPSIILNIGVPIFSGIMLDERRKVSKLWGYIFVISGGTGIIGTVLALTERYRETRFSIIGIGFLPILLLIFRGVLIGPTVKKSSTFYPERPICRYSPSLVSLEGTQRALSW